MKRSGIFIFLLLTIQTGFSADNVDQGQPNRKGKFYLYWGYNRGWFSKSDIHFTGTNYDFTLKNVVGKDRQSPFDAGVYLNPTKITIPQFNFRLGFFIKDNYNVSFGIDHMKYVVQQNQVVKISGSIRDVETKYNGTYSDNDIAITPDFLKFEHTNGLNYLNLEFRRFDEIATIGKFSFNVTEGVGTGVLLPRTDATLMNMDRHDEFHLAGYGVGGVVGVNIAFLKYLFVQTEYKGGFINMPDIRTTSSLNDKASQHFFFSQFNFALGITVGMKHHKNES